MPTEKLYIRNMVCSRCKMIVQQELEKAGAEILHLELGEATLKEPLSPAQLAGFKEALTAYDFEVIDDKKSRIIEKIKKVVISLVQEQVDTRLNYSAYIAAQLDMDYTYLSNLFSSVEGTTIEKFIIENKIEKAKELLVYDELSLTQIAERLGYSSIAHLSNQFKKTTGLTPSSFRKLGAQKRRPLDQL